MVTVNPTARSRSRASTLNELAALAPQILAAIQQAKNILLHCHVGPDEDSVGSALAMRQVLTGLGKQATVIGGDSPLNTSLQFLPGFGTIVPKNFFEIDLGGFDLFVSLDTAGLDMISRRGNIVFPPHLKVINIDHHSTNPRFGEINLVTSEFSSTSELLWELFGLWQIPVTQDVAVCLFTGIYGDTGGFKHANTNRRVFGVVAKLLEFVPDEVLTSTIFSLENNRSKESMILMSLALNSIEAYLDDQVAMASVSAEQIARKGISSAEAVRCSVSGLLKSVVGWNIGVTLIEVAPSEVKVSLRTRDANKFDVGAVAKELGGGGHKAAAGATIKLPLAEAKKLVVDTIARLCF